MSTTEEEIRALQWGEKLLFDLAVGNIKRVPKKVREHASIILRHFPTKTSLEIYWTRGRKKH